MWMTFGFIVTADEVDSHMMVPYSQNCEAVLIIL